MHLVFLNQYYPPDAAPTGVMLEAVAKQLVEDGHDVTILCAAGGYAGERVISDQLAVISEDEDAVHAPVIQNPNIIRIGATSFGRASFVGKLVDYASYYLGVSWKLLTMRPRPDRIVALTTPPYLSVLARGISKFRAADHAHWVMDLYPDVMCAHGMLKPGAMPHRLLTRLARWGFSGTRCAAVLTLGPDMAERVARVRNQQHEGRTQTEVQWVPLWGTGQTLANGPDCSDASTSVEEKGIANDLDCASALRKQRGWAEDELIVMYSGNMGLGHRFGEILEAARSSKAEKMRFVFYGGGKRRREIEQFAKQNPDCRIELHDYAPLEQLAPHLQSADVHLASLDSSWTGTMVPSKLQGIFAAARPVIFIGSEASSIGQWVKESDAGWVVEPGNTAQLLTALHDADKPNSRLHRNHNAKRFSDEHFDKTRNVTRVAKIISR